MTSAVDRLVAIAAAAARRLGSDVRSRRRAALDALLAVANAGAEDDVPGAAVVAEVIRRDRPFDPGRDSWSLQLDARALPIGALLSVGGAAEAIERMAPPSGVCFLDAGGGLGDATRAFLDRSPDGRAILVDTQPVLDAARRHLGGLAERVTFVAADLRHDVLPACDVALISNVLHLHAAPDRTAIVGAVVRATRGMVAIKDVALADTGDGPLAALAFGLITTIFGDGAVVTERELAELARAAGREPSVHRMRVAAECALVLC